MTIEDVAERLKKILVDHAGYPMAPHAIQAHTSLYGKGLGLSSLDVVALIVRIEDEFNVFFEGDEIGPSVATFGALVHAIHGKLPADGTTPSEDDR